MVAEFLSWAWQVVAALLLVLGGLFTLVGAIGLVRLRDFYMRLHAPTKATTLGVGALLLASMLAGAAQGVLAVAELLVALFFFITAPISAALLAQAALHRRERSQAPSPDRAPEPPEPPEEPVAD